MRFNSHRLRSLSPDVLDYGLFLPSIWLACSLGISLRLIGPLFALIPIGSCVIYAVLRTTVPPRLLSVYLAFSLLIAILSKYQLMPNSWQVHFMEEAIVRQLIPLLGFFAVAWASKAYFRRRLICGDVFFGRPLILVLSLVVAPAIMFQQGLRYQGDEPADSVLALYGAFINNILIAMFFITGAIFLTADWRRYVGLATVIGIAVMTHFAQFRILTLIAIITLLGASGRVVVIGLAVTLIGIYAVGMNHMVEMMIAIPNFGLRLAFVADALWSVVDTHGMGIGYGKESVRWRYQFPNMTDFTFLPDPGTITADRMLELLSTGVHNSFVQALLRTGVLGFLLLVPALLVAFPPRDLPRNVRNHAAVVFGMILIACFVNPALETPVVVVGIGFVYGYLLALRTSADNRTVAVGVRSLGALLSVGQAQTPAHSKS
jgi:hypothetical protein